MQPNVQSKSESRPIPKRIVEVKSHRHLRYFHGHMELDKMAIDPGHFRHGYGTLLCRHGMAIAAEDKVPVGVIAAELGMHLYKSSGFTTVVKYTLADERPGFEASVDFWVQKWNGVTDVVADQIEEKQEL